jgi:hypothetical protein
MLSEIVGECEKFLNKKIKIEESSQNEYTVRNVFTKFNGMKEIDAESISVKVANLLSYYKK